MKTTPDNPTPCDHEQLSRYHDGEATSQEIRRIEAHLPHCPDCRNMLADFDRLGHLMRSHGERALAAADTSAVMQRLLTRRQQRREAFAGWRNWFKPARLFLPVTVTVLALAIYIIPRPFKIEPDGQAPSAIINSFTGSVTSVMLFETPNTHQTIIWFKEDSTAKGENDALQKI
mgnify:CR=1 FL=1